MNSQHFESYVPVYDVVPEKWEDAREFLVEHLKKISNAVNIREIGWYLDEELLSGKQFIPGVTATGNVQQFRSVFRKIIDFGALPNTGFKAVPHGINVDTRFTLLHLYACATDPVGLTSFEIDHAENLTGNVWMYMDANNINIVTNSNRSSYSRCFVTVEYILEL